MQTKVDGTSLRFLGFLNQETQNTKAHPEARFCGTKEDSYLWITFHLFLKLKTFIMKIWTGMMFGMMKPISINWLRNIENESRVSCLISSLQPPKRLKMKTVQNAFGRLSVVFLNVEYPSKMLLTL